MPTWAQLIANTDAMRRRRGAPRARVAPATPPSAAIMGYTSVADDFMKRFDKAQGRGSLAVLDELLKVRTGTKATKAVRDAQRHARDELARQLGKPIKALPTGDRAVSDAFVAEQERLWRKLAADVANELATNGPEAARKLAERRARLIVADQAHKAQAEAMAYYAQANGSVHYTWVTRHDERVREGHAVLDGTLQRWDAPPNTGRKEGHNHPGQAVNCRCSVVAILAPQRTNRGA